MRDEPRREGALSQTNDPRLAGRLATAAQNLLGCGKYRDAEKYARECLAIRERVLPDSWQLFNTYATLGGALAGQKKNAEAESLLLKGYRGLKQREAKIPPRTRTRLVEARQRLVELYTAWGKPDDARKWRTAPKARPPASLPPDNSKRANRR